MKKHRKYSSTTTSTSGIETLFARALTWENGSAPTVRDDLDLHGLDLSPRTRDALLQAGISNVAQLRPLASNKDGLSRLGIESESAYREIKYSLGLKPERPRNGTANKSDSPAPAPQKPTEVPAPSPEERYRNLERDFPHLARLIERYAPVVGEHEVWDILAERYKTPPTEMARDKVRALMQSRGYEKFTIKIFNAAFLPAWVLVQGEHENIAKAATPVPKLFRSQLEPISLSKLSAKVKEEHPGYYVTDRLLERAIALYPRAEIMSDGKFRTRLAGLQTPAQQAYQIIYDRGEPMEIGELVDAINERLQAEGVPQSQWAKASGVRNGGTNGQYVTLINKSKYWGLPNWEHQQRAILSVMQQYFDGHPQAASVEDITDYLTEKLPVSRKVAEVYLKTSGIFNHVGHGKYEPASWGRQAVGRRGPRPKVERTAKAGATRMGRPRKSVDGTAKPARAGTGRPGEKGEGRVTAASKVRDAVRKVLAQTPGHEMSGSELVTRVHKDTSVDKGSIYAYIARMTDLAPQGKRGHTTYRLVS